MARRFVRVDLSDLVRDFRPIAVEPGVPLLDHSQANARILHKWLGGLVAEPEWEGESVAFFVQDDHGGRLENVVCELASEADLKGPLKADLEALRQRISRVKPETSTERAVHKTLLREFAKLVDDEHPTDRTNSFFRYKDANGRWRLVWCWGYQRGDQEPTTPLVCRNPECNLLFVRRSGQKGKCPSCQAMQVPTTAKPKPRKRRLLVALLLLLLVAFLMSGLLNQRQLITTPSHWTGPVGSRVEFTVHKPGLFGLGGQDVTRQAVAVSGDPRIVHVDRSGMVAQASGPGKTVVRFFLGDRTAIATVTVEPAKPLSSVVIEPQTLELAIGTTAQLRLMGDYGDGVQVDLTDAAYWAPARDGIVYSHDGRVEGLAEGTTQIIARYQATPESKPLEATAKVNVTKLDFQRLEVHLAPLPVPLGQGSRLHVNAIDPTGKEYSVLESSHLNLRLTPSDIATLEKGSVVGRQTGHGTIEANWSGQLSADLPFEVAAAPAVTSLVVSPEQLDLVVGEIADLDIASPSTAPARITSDDPSVAEVTDSNRIVGCSPGTTQLTVTQDNMSRNVPVTVTKAKLRSIALEPMHIVVPITKTTPVRVIGQIDDDRYVELAPDSVKVEKRPAPEYASLDDNSLELRGLRPTEKGSPQTLEVAAESLQASAPVEVVLPPGETMPTLHADGPSKVEILSAQEPVVIDPATTAIHSGQAPDREGPPHLEPDVPTAEAMEEQGPPVSVVAAGQQTARFQTVRPSISDNFVPDFTVKLDIVAAKSQRPLEYRAYVSGQTLPDAWTPAQLQKDSQQAVVTSPPIHTGPFSTIYDLTLEARDPTDGSIEQYPLRFRLSPGVDVQTPEKPPAKEPPSTNDEKPRGPFDEDNH